ncbi:hypothetical protein BAZSYMA_ACONTIG00569_0 [Bathymodiolus azoricus thioautotrophic gill symbiont]|uniref:Uncharacterized protein n=1 Tax=Bathymodiolus azoricus thioautotrophic gill symbiont TaxID=235205 RepID=A0A1H6MRZ6_9GAMM|nr:hypothetical protein BAZSYMA_ACONTIG00569_0 [Bathymodiolus azoricus thioautotrophic gill symbiont]
MVLTHSLPAIMMPIILKHKKPDTLLAMILKKPLKRWM